MPMLLTCPGCKQQMTIPDESRGLLVRCPACGTTFSSSPDVNPPPSSTAVQAQGPALGPGYVQVASDKADLARPSGEPTGIGRDVRWEDGDPMSIRRKPARSSGGLLVVVVGGVLLLVGIVVALALMMPGLGDRGNVARQGPHDLLSLAPADSIFLFGMTVPRGQQDALKLEQAKQQLLQAGAPAYLGELLTDSERVLVAGEYAKALPTAVAALLTRTPYDREKLKKALDMGPARTVDGATIHTIKVANVMVPIEEVYVAMPEPRVLIVGVMPEADFVKILANHGNPPALKGDLLARAREIEGSAMWAVLANEGIVKQKLQEFDAKQMPQMADWLPMLQNCKNASIVAELVNKDTRCELRIDCKDDADAKKLQKLVDGAWKGTLLLGKVFAAKEPKADLLFKDVERTFKVEQKATAVVASFLISENTGKQLEQINPMNNQALPKRKAKK